MNLELMALRWLLYERRCEIALCERSPRAGSCGQPDVLGVTPARFTVEIEIKRSVSDFRADRHKRSRNEVFRPGIAHKLPKQFYYLVPAELVDKVKPLVPEWAGLMTPADQVCDLTVITPAPVNRESRRLSVRECLKLVRMVNNHAMTALETRQACYDRFRDGHWAWPEPDYEI